MVARSPGAPPLSMDWMPELSMSTGWNVMPRAVTPLGPSTSAVESKFGPPECPGSSTTTGRVAVQTGAGSAGGVVGAGFAGGVTAAIVRPGWELGAGPEAPQAAARHAAAA